MRTARNIPLLDPASPLARYAARHGLPALEAAARFRRRRAHVHPLPSLRGAPTATDIGAPWVIIPRTLRDVLLIGSRLLDLEPTVDNSFIFGHDRLTGQTRIIRRNPGVKGWLRDHCPTVAYSTAMRYKMLAARVRTACGLPPYIPLEWILPGSIIPASVPQSATIRAAIRAARTPLAALLTEHTTQASLAAEMDKRLGLIRLRGRKTWLKSPANPFRKFRKSPFGPRPAVRLPSIPPWFRPRAAVDCGPQGGGGQRMPPSRGPTPPSRG